MSASAERSENRSPHQPWIDVYPFNGRGFTFENTGARISLQPDLRRFVDERWKPKAKNGWTSSWVAFANNVTFNDREVQMGGGAMQFHEISGMNQAIEEGEPFAPQQGYVNCLSVGFVTATSDGNVILQRRGSDVHVPNTLIHEPTGYMASMMFAPRSECARPNYASDPRLFDVIGQLEARRTQIAETFDIDPALVSYDHLQDFLGAGWLSTEMYFSTTGKIAATESELTPPTGTEIRFVPFEELKPLILNQGKLAGVYRAGHRPDVVGEIPLIDESLLGLIYGYTKLTGETIDVEETIDRLNDDGLQIRVLDTAQGKTYEFPTSF